MKAGVGPRVRTGMCDDVGMRNESQLWLARFQHYDAQGRQLLERTVQLVGVGMTLLATLMAVVSTAESDWSGLLAVVPVVVLLLWTIASRTLHEFFYVMAFKDYAEIKMFGKSGDAREGFSSWHAVATPAILRGLPNVTAYVLIALFSLALVVISIFQLWNALPDARPWIATEAAVVGVGLVVVVVGFRRTLLEMNALSRQLDEALDNS